MRTTRSFFICVAIVVACAAMPVADVPEDIEKRRNDDFETLQSFRPGYTFWRHIFTIPDGSIAYGSAIDGRLLAVFPTRGDWIRDADWKDPSLANLLAGRQLARDLDTRREQVAALLEQVVGPVLHNPTRGRFLLPNAQRYGRFVGEWAAIYERFGVPPEIGLAQAILESGFNPTRRSEARAVGFCQWLARNWRRLNRLSPHVIEGHNQTTQAPYCAAYLSVLATKYGSFVPALSEHNAGGTNVGRRLITGAHLGAEDVRTRYFLGAKLARDLRALPGKEYENVYQSYGPRSYLYAEMVFGNTLNVRSLIASTPQTSIHAMRAPRAISLAEIIKRTSLPADEVRRFNPALVGWVPAQATLYLPSYVSEFGPDVAFWRRPPSPAYVAVLNDFVRLDPGAEQWDDPAFAPVLTDFKRRFRETNTEEGVVMETVLTYAMDQAYTSSRRTLLSEFRRSDLVRRLIERGVLELDVLRDAQTLRVAAVTF
ncbi:MAG: transglycosylase SLT domain-containing protein [Panacagrimonas sp.]